MALPDDVHGLLRNDLIDKTACKIQAATFAYSLNTLALPLSTTSLVDGSPL